MLVCKKKKVEERRRRGKRKMIRPIKIRNDRK
jgi:hypothetical protein